MIFEHVIVKNTMQQIYHSYILKIQNNLSDNLLVNWNPIIKNFQPQSDIASNIPI